MAQMSTELTVHVDRSLTPSAWDMISAVAPAMHRSHLFGVASPEQAMAIMLTGYELGLTLTASFEFVKVIQGKPSLIPRGALALVLRSPDLAGLKVEDITDAKGNPESCRVTMKRRNGFEYTTSFSMADAQRAGLMKDDSGWSKYPANMLRWRAIGFCADVVFPDVIGGMKRADELGADLTPEGDVIEGTWASVAPVTPPPTPAPAAIDLNTLVARYGAEAVLAANDGKIPATDLELNMVAEALEDDDTFGEDSGNA